MKKQVTLCLAVLSVFLLTGVGCSHAKDQVATESQVAAENQVTAEKPVAMENKAGTARQVAAETTADVGKAKTLFTDGKCNKCHSVKSAGIEQSEKPEKGQKSPPDLSGAGGDGDAAWFKEFLTKKAKAKDGKLHPKKFKGSDEDLTALADWFASMKDGDAPSVLYKKAKK